MGLFAVKVYGCQMNTYDGDRIRTALIQKGWSETDPGKADAVIYVGCSIRDKAEQKVKSEIGLHGKSWKKTGRPMVCLLGCMAQNTGRELFSRFPWLRLIAGPRSLGPVPDAMDRVMKGERVDLLDPDPLSFNDLDAAPICRLNPWKAYVTIAHGCDNFCTYCIVPYVRGRFMSRSPCDILKEVRELVEDGVKEICLLGQNVDTYGADFSMPYGFADLLAEVAGVDGLDLVRFMTSYPTDMTKDVISVMAEHPKICPAINLPLQSGSDSILKKMNRRYNLARYDETVRTIREGLPEVGLTSDLIVGFPGETEDDFLASMDAVRHYRFDQLHTAAYSPRKGTPAAVMACQVDREEKSRRLKEINGLQAKIALEINKGLVGRVYRVLMDGEAQRGAGLLQGRTGTDKVVLAKGDRSLLGNMVLVRIVEADNWSLKGEIISP